MMTPKLALILDQSVTLLESLKENGPTDGSGQILQTFLETDALELPFQDFDQGLEWFNVTRPLSVFKDLAGKVTVLDFFTYCCINCLHVLPKLHELEESISVEDGLVIIGVHSAKFNNEKDSNNIKAALARYNITHPVVNDAEGIMWNALGIAAWPTMLVLGPDAYPLLIVAGEQYMPQLKFFVNTAVKYYKEKGKLSSHTLPIAVDVHLPASGPLLFPGKIAFCEALRDSKLGYLAIADTGHHRILVCRDHGEIEYVVGGEEPGLADGDFDVTKFSSPQGVTFHGRDIIYVADTGNDSIRKIDLVKGKVSTIVGKHGSGFAGDSTFEGNLSSPWDICVMPDNSVLLIAAAGSHQLWAYAFLERIFWRKVTLAAHICKPVAGTGKEENRNNAYPHAAAFAQPSGICVAPTLNAAFVADSESSSIRRVVLETGQVMAVVGGNRSPTDLFCFGDTDGRMWDVRLQHPLGVACTPHGSSVYVVDSYNHKVKVIDPDERTCRTYLGLGTAGDSVEEGKEQFSEPGGLCTSSCGDRLFVADTNNHCIKVIYLKTKQVKKLDVHMKVKENQTGAFKCLKADAVVDVSGAHVTCRIQFKIEDNITLLADVPPRWTLKLPSNFGWLADSIEGNLTVENPIQLVEPITFLVPPGNPGQASEVLVLATLLACDKVSGACYKKCLSAGIIVKQLAGAPSQLFLGPDDFRQS